MKSRIKFYLRANNVFKSQHVIPRQLDRDLRRIFRLLRESEKMKTFLCRRLVRLRCTRSRTPVCLHSHQHIYCLNVLGILGSLNKKREIRYLIASFCALLWRYRVALYRMPLMFEKALRNKICINSFLPAIMLVIVWASNSITGLHFISFQCTSHPFTLEPLHYTSPL